MLHLIKNSLKLKLKNPYIIFWPMIFPLIMATLFYVSLNDIDEGHFESVPVSVVEIEGEENSIRATTFKKFLENIERENPEKKLISVTYMKDDEALKALENNKVKGIFYSGTKTKLKLSQDGLGESILKTIFDSFNQGYYTVENCLPILSDFPKDMRTTFVEKSSFNGNDLKISSQFFYALIGMSCLYGCFIGLGCIDVLQANLSKAAIRCSISPTHKLKLILSEMIAAFGLHFMDVIILLIYLRYILKICLTGNMPMMLVVVFAGSLIGVSIGIFVGSFKSKNVDIKVGILLAISMSFSFFAGLMNNQMKYIVEKNFPLFNRINPAALISDAMYCINVYEDPTRFTRDIILLFVISSVLITAAFMSVRRVRYDSI